MPAPAPHPRFWLGVTVALLLSVPLWAGLVFAVRQVLP